MLSAAVMKNMTLRFALLSVALFGIGEAHANLAGSNPELRDRLVAMTQREPVQFARQPREHRDMHAEPFEKARPLPLAQPRFVIRHHGDQAVAMQQFQQMYELRVRSTDRPFWRHYESVSQNHCPFCVRLLP